MVGGIGCRDYRPDSTEKSAAEWGPLLTYQSFLEVQFIKIIKHFRALKHLYLIRNDEDH